MQNSKLPKLGYIFPSFGNFCNYAYNTVVDYMYRMYHSSLMFKNIINYLWLYATLSIYFIRLVKTLFIN